MYMRKLVSGAAAAALLVATATPALADGRGFGGPGGGFGGGYGGYGGYGERHHDRGDNGGDILAGLAIFGVIAAVAIAASSSNKNKNNSNDNYPRNSDGRYGDINSENAAVDACAKATEARAGDSASVREINSVDRNSDGWDVQGTVEQRDSWRSSSADRHHFRCTVRYGSVDRITIESDRVAYGY